LITRDDKNLPKAEVVARKRTVTGEDGRPKVVDVEYMEWYTPKPPGNKVWTDDYSNMVGILREKYAFTILIGLLVAIGVMVAVILLYGKSLEQQQHQRTHGS
jgi:hypothetical protein